MADQNANSTVQKGGVLHGARVFLTVNGRVVGYCTRVSVNKQVNVQDVEALDDILTTEHVPTGVTYSGNISLVKIVGRSLVDAGIAVPLADILNANILNFALVDRPTGKVVRVIRRVTLTAESQTIQKNVLTAHEVSFKAIDAAEESGQP